MKKNILQYLEYNAQNYANKTIFDSDEVSINWYDFMQVSQKIGVGLINYLNSGARVAVFIDKTINCLIGMFGSMYAGDVYTIIDVESPMDRVQSILETFQPSCILTDKRNYEKCQSVGVEKVLVIEELEKCEINIALLNSVRTRQIDTDPLYVLFTSGSTGTPKGTVVCHRSVIDYAETVCKTFEIDSDTIWGSQTPFYFSMSILDIFTTVVAGATLCIIPKIYFSLTATLVEYMNEKRINAIYWVPTAFSIVATLDTFFEVVPQYLKKVLFAGESMPVKILNYWMNYLPDAMYANLFGPTEITDTCTYYVVDRKFEDNELLPIGKPFDNCDVIIIGENGKRVSSFEDGEGELYVRGSFLGLGYYADLDKTNEAFVQNPFNNSYPELLYKTGDVVRFNDSKELVYIGRKDYQIKHLGHRIELGEIEAAAMSIQGVNQCCCVYDNNNSIIVLFVVGTASLKDIKKQVIEAVPKYMIPHEIRIVDSLPLNMNGKIDRKKLTTLVMDN